MGLQSNMTDALMQRINLDTDTQEECYVKMEAEINVIHL